MMRWYGGVDIYDNCVETYDNRINTYNSSQIM